MRSSSATLAALAALVAATYAHAQATPVGDTVVLIVNGEPVKRSAVDKLLEPVRKAKVPPNQFVRYQERAVQNIVTDMLLAQYLKAEAFKPTKEEVGSEIARRKRIYESTLKPGAPDFATMLRSIGTSVADMMARPDARLCFSCCIRRGLTEKDILRAYEAEKDLWAKVRARHILIGTRNLKTVEEKTSAAAKAEGVRARLLAGEDFAAVAMQLSDCPSKNQGGDLGFFKRSGQMVEPFAKAAFELEVNGISPVVETQFGYHVIQTTIARKPDAPLAEVREFISDSIAEKRGQKMFGDIYKSAKIVRPQPPGAPKAPGAPGAGRRPAQPPARRAPATPPPAQK
jgi:parvulin-like peptidyl-prolyl isomerase